MASDIFSNNVRIKGIRPLKKTNIIVGRTGKIEFARETFIAGRTTIRVESGVCIFCVNLSCNTNCSISCTEKVTFGDNCLSGCYINMRDSSGHTTILNDVEQVSLRSVKIGKGIWTAANVDVLKGATIGDVDIVGYRSCATRSVSEEHCITAGYPAKVVRGEID